MWSFGMAYRLNKSGFTIVELMISISVFSVVIILASAAIITVGRQYQFGVSKTRLLDASRELNQKISQDIAYSGGEKKSVADLPAGYTGFCIGSTAYIWVPYTVSPDNFDWAKNKFRTADLSTGGCNHSSFKSRLINPFPNNVVVTALDIGTTSPYQYNSRFVLADGTDLFVGKNPNNSCITQQAGGSYCAVVDMNSTITRKVQ